MKLLQVLALKANEGLMFSGLLWQTDFFAIGSCPPKKLSFCPFREDGLSIFRISHKKVGHVEELARLAYLENF